MTSDFTLFQRVIRWFYVRYVLKPELQKHVSYRIMIMNDETIDAMYEREMVSLVNRVDH
jgi:hypothetical protein